MISHEISQELEKVTQKDLNQGSVNAEPVQGGRDKSLSWRGGNRVAVTSGRHYETDKPREIQSLFVPHLVLCHLQP